MDDLLWHLPGDLRRVKELTMGCLLELWGVKRGIPIGRPLPGRASIVMTRDANWHADGAIAARDLKMRFCQRELSNGSQASRQARRATGFGGGQIYELGLEQCDVIEMTEVDLAPEGPACFPPIDTSLWQEVSRQEVEAAEDVPAHRFLRYERRETP